MGSARLLLALVLSTITRAIAAAKPRPPPSSAEVLEALGLGSWPPAAGSAPFCEFKRVPASKAKQVLIEARKAEERNEDTEPFVLEGLADWTQQSSWTLDAVAAKHGDLTIGTGDPGTIQAFGGLPQASKKLPLRDFLAAPHPRGHVAFFSVDKSHKQQRNFLSGVKVAEELSDFSTGKAFMISAGHDGTGLSPHVHGDTWLSLVLGAKLWLLQHPAKAMWAPRHHLFAQELQKKGKPVDTLMCVQQPGETVFVPAGWGHATVNIGLTLGVGQQEPPGMPRRATFDANPDNIHTLLRAAMAASKPSAQLRHARKILSQEQDNAEALTLQVQTVLYGQEFSDEEKHKVCKRAKKQLRKWLKDNDSEDELTRTALSSIQDSCNNNLEL